MKAKLDAGEITLQHYGWHAELSEWVALSEIPQIAHAPAPVPGAEIAAARAAAGVSGGSAGSGTGTNHFTDVDLTSYASPWLRLAAMIIDGIIVGLVNVVVVVVVVAMVAAAGGDEDGAEAAAVIGQLVAQILGIVIYLGYATVLESSSLRGTLGKHLLGIMVVTESGEQLNIGQAAGRLIIKWISGCIILLYLVLFFTPKKQALHDMALKTLVLNKPKG